jgi:prevent-host-death family protein
MTVSVRELKNRLSHYLRRVRAGDRIVVTDRGRPVAEVKGVGRERLSPEERLRRLADRGEIALPRGRGLEDLEPARVRGRRVSATLLEDRG